MSEHTKEPWAAKALGNADTDPRWIITGVDSFVATTTAGNDEANARRIVAAVNACKGIETGALENGAVRGFADAAGEWAEIANEMEARADEAERLLSEALRGHRHMPMYNGRPSCPWCGNFVDEEETHLESCIVHEMRAFLNRAP